MIADPICKICKRKMVWIGLGGGAEPACPRDCGCCPRCNALPDKQELISCTSSPEALEAAAAAHSVVLAHWMSLPMFVPMPKPEQVKPETWMRCSKCSLDWKVTSWFSSAT